MYDYMKTIISALKHWVAEIIFKSTADWEQHDASQADYIKNRPFYDDRDSGGELKRIDHKYLPEDIGVQADWAEADESSKAFILNKPDVLLQTDIADWAKSDTKPTYTADEVGALPNTYEFVGRFGSGTCAEIFNDYDNNIASGDYSHAEGNGTVANTANISVQGTYNSFVDDSYVMSSREYSKITTASSAEGYRISGYNFDEKTGKFILSGVSTSKTLANSIYVGTEFVVDYSVNDGVYTSDSIYRCTKKTNNGSGYSVTYQIYYVNSSKNIKGKYANIVGNGSSDDARSNAYTLDWDGNAWFAGDVYIGGTSQDDINTKKLVSTERLGTTYMVLTDTISGYEYVIQIENGNLVSFCKCDHIEVTAMPAKTEYVQGDTFDPTGMVIKSISQDGSAKVIENYFYTECVMSDSVEIQYVECGATYTVSVPVTITPFDAVTALVDFNYTANSDGTYTLTGWKQTLNGEPSTEMIVPNNSLIIV